MYALYEVKSQLPSSAETPLYTVYVQVNIIYM